MLAGILDSKLRAAGLPIEGVGIGRRDDKATWRVDWATEPTVQQLAQAQAIIDALNIEVEEAKAVEEQGLARAEVIARGIARVLVAKGVCTANEIKAAIKTEWDSVKVTP